MMELPISGLACFPSLNQHSKAAWSIDEAGTFIQTHTHSESLTRRLQALRQKSAARSIAQYLLSVAFQMACAHTCTQTLVRIPQLRLALGAGLSHLLCVRGLCARWWGPPPASVRSHCGRANFRWGCWSPFDGRAVVDGMGWDWGVAAVF